MRVDRVPLAVNRGGAGTRLAVAGARGRAGRHQHRERCSSGGRRCLRLLLSAGWGVWIGVVAASGTAADRSADDLQRGFLQPPATARPWVYWFWLNGNITRAGITADLEAVNRSRKLQRLAGRIDN